MKTEQKKTFRKLHVKNNHNSFYMTLGGFILEQASQRRDGPQLITTKLFFNILSMRNVSC
jgi:hypothetical protein